MGSCETKNPSSLNYKDKNNSQDINNTYIRNNIYDYLYGVNKPLLSSDKEQKELSTPTGAEDITYNNTQTPGTPITEIQPPENLEKIIVDSKNYFECEKDFINRLNTTSQTQGFLVDILWVNDWKTKSNYELIKKEYFDKGIVDIKSIQNDILSNHKDKEFKYLENNDIENYILDNDIKIKQILEKDNSYVLLNNKFLEKFTTNSTIKPINLYFSPKELKIKLTNGKFLLFKTEDIILNKEKCFNSISSIKVTNKPTKDNIPKTENIDNFELLKHLFKYLFFSMQLNSPKNGFSLAYIVNKKVISKIKVLYNLKEEILPIIEKENLFQGITYENFNNNYKNIINKLYQNNNNFLNRIKQYEEPGAITFNDTECIIEEANIVGKPNLKYYFNFEIIDKDFGDFLGKLNKNLILFQVSYIKIENKIFLIINKNKKYIYEILSFIPENFELNAEYVIEIIQANNINDVNSIVNSIIPFLQIIDMFSPGMINNGANNINFIFHKINQKESGSPQKDNVNENISKTVIDPRLNQNKIFGQNDNNINSSIKNFSNTTIGNNLFKQNNPQFSDLSKQFFLIDKDFFDIISPKLNKDNNDIYPQINVPQNNSNNVINYSFVNINNKPLYYPTNFNVIDKTLFSQIISIYKNQSVKNLVEEIYLIPVNGGFFCSFKNNMIVNINNLTLNVLIIMINLIGFP